MLLIILCLHLSILFGRPSYQFCNDSDDTPCPLRFTSKLETYDSGNDSDCFTIQREAAGSDLESARSQLCHEKYCVLNVYCLGYGSHQNLYDSARRNITDVAVQINRLRLMNDTIMIEEDERARSISLIGTPTGYLHRDDDFLNSQRPRWRKGERFTLWIPAVSNKYLAVIPVSSFPDKSLSATFPAEWTHEAVRYHLKRYGRISATNALVLFKSTSCSRPLDVCIHTGIMNKFARQKRLIQAENDPMSVLIDLKAVTKDNELCI